VTRSRITAGDGDPRHGTANGYGNLKCRCPRCTRAWRDKFWLCNTYRTTETAEQRRAKYALARDHGYSPREAMKRAHWSDPLEQR
jgi:hypothetical protein